MVGNTRGVVTVRWGVVTVRKLESRTFRTICFSVYDRESALTRLQSALEEAVAERETLEAHLNESTRSSESSLNSSVTKKVIRQQLYYSLNVFSFLCAQVDKMKAKLKQQVSQTNHLRTKLGITLLYKLDSIGGNYIAPFDCLITLHRLTVYL